MKICNLFFVVMIAFSVVFTGCKAQDPEIPKGSTKPPQEQAPRTNADMAKKYGLLGEIPVYRSEKKLDGANTVYSPYFSNSKEGKINFLFKATNGEIVMVDLDHTEYRVIKDENKQVPTVEILFFKPWLDEQINTRYEGGGSPGDNWQKLGPGWYFRGFSPEAIIVRISSECLKKEMAFPF